MQRAEEAVRESIWAVKLLGAIFDLDGTILDSMFIWDKIGEDYLLRRGIAPEKGLSEKLKAMSLLDSAVYYRERYGILDDVETIAEDINDMLFHFYACKAELKSGVFQTIEHLRSAGIKMCIATATDRVLVEAALKRIGILHYFGKILTCTEVGFGKSSPEIYNSALEYLDLDIEEVLVFEDAIHAVETAKNSGFKVVGVYDESSIDDQEEIKRLSDYYLKSFTERSFQYD